MESIFLTHKFNPKNKSQHQCKYYKIYIAERESL